MLKTLKKIEKFKDRKMKNNIVLQKLKQTVILHFKTKVKMSILKESLVTCTCKFSWNIQADNLNSDWFQHVT